MASNKAFPVLLAGSLFLAGLANVADARLENVDATRPEDTRLTRMEDLVDVSTKHWAYSALEELVERYDVIEGYSLGNGKYKYDGNKPATRYEMAAALRDVLYLVRSGKLYMNNGDAKTLAALEDEFAPELGALKARTEALEARTADLESKVNAWDNIEIGGDFTVGALGAFQGNDNGSYQDATQAVSRLRLTVEAPVVQDDGEGFLAEGRIKARMVAAIGGNNGGIAGLSRIGADASAANESFSGGNVFGNAANTVSTNTRQNVYLDRAGYEQDFRLFNNEHTFFAGVLPWRDYFDVSAYRGDENFQFQNTAFTNIPGMPANASMAMVGAKTNFVINDDLNTGLTLAAGAPNDSNVINNYIVTAEGRLNYKWSDWDDRGTSLYAGLVGIFNDSVNQAPRGLNPVNRAGAPFTSTRGNSHTVYAGLDQELYKGIGVNLAYMYNDASDVDRLLNAYNQNYGAQTGLVGLRNIAAAPRQAGTFALSVPTDSLGFRNDTFGIAYGVLDFSDEFSGNGRDRWTQVIETYYNFKLNDRVSIIPSLQANNNILGDSNNDMLYAAGLRTSIKF